jgi:hypothetical protein
MLVIIRKKFVLEKKNHQIMKLLELEYDFYVHFSLLAANEREHFT